jgi:hypothetical protein
LGPAQLLPSPDWPTLSDTAHVRCLLPYFRTAPDTARPAPVSTAPAQLPDAGPRSPSLHAALDWTPLLPLHGATRAGPPHPPFPLRFGAKAIACPLSPISSSACKSGRLKPPTPRSSAAKCLLPGIGFHHPSSEIAERPPPSLLHGELRYSPSPSQNGLDSSCSFSLWSSGTHPCHHWPPKGIIAI